MITDSDIKLLAEDLPVDYGCTGAEIVEFELDIYGQLIHFRISITQKQVKLSAIVPLARSITDRITNTVIEKIVNLDSGCVPCHKGCGACCYYFVSMSIPEVFWFRYEILKRPQYQRNNMLRAILLAARRVLKHIPPKWFYGQTSQFKTNSLANLNTISSWYRNLKLPCPFLNKGQCLVYNQRPLACRSYFIKGSSRACKGKRGKRETIEMPIRITNVLSQLTSKLDNTDTEAIIVPLAFVWSEDNLHRDEQKRPAMMVVERFIEIIKATALQNAAKSLAAG